MASTRERFNYHATKPLLRAYGFNPKVELFDFYTHIEYDILNMSISYSY